MRLCEQLGIEKGVTSVIGSGGKTTMLHVLARELCRNGTVILTTSTHIRPSDEFPCLFSPSEEEVRAALQEAPAVCVGSLTEDGKFTACSLSFETLSSLADYVLVEADGSKRLPLKAHASHEPVIPENSQKSVCVVGASGLGKPIREAVHRPALFCAMTGASEEDIATPELTARVLMQEALGDIYFIDQCEEAVPRSYAEALAARLDKPVICGSLRCFLSNYSCGIFAASNFRIETSFRCGK